MVEPAARQHAASGHRWRETRRRWAPSDCNAVIVPPVSSNTPPPNWNGPLTIKLVARSVPPLSVSAEEIVAVPSTVRPLPAAIVGTHQRDP